MFGIQMVLLRIMRVFIDLGHPAHVHYFKNIILKLQIKGWKFFISARNKDVTNSLLDYYRITYFNRGTGSKTSLGKLWYILTTDISLFKQVKNFNPDIAISFGTIYAGHVSKMLNIPHIAFDDTEHATEQQILSNPFCSVILTPKAFKKQFGQKQVRFDGFMELCYLHKNWFKPDKSILNSVGLSEDDKFAIVRFVSWDASHDRGYSEMGLEQKMKLIENLKKVYRVFVSSESEIPNELKADSLNIHPSKLHDLMFFSSLFIGEGGTMASESVCLGVPSIYINPLPIMGYLEEQKKAGLLYHFTNIEKDFSHIMTIINNFKKDNAYSQKVVSFLNKKIDVSSMLLWFIENYPKSFEIMKNNSDYQYNFK